MDGSAIAGERLTAWSVSPDGERVRLGFEDAAGRACAVSLPVAMLSALMMTIPRMLRAAMAARFADGSLRMIHPLGDWRVEQAEGMAASILSLATPDGFEVAFALAAPQADRLGETLRRAAESDAAVASVVN